MGFRNGAYATVWEKEDKEKYTKARISISRKNKTTGEYETDFSGFISLVGEAHKNADNIKNRDRIHIKECDVTTTYDREKKKGYTNFTIYDFEILEPKKPDHPSGGDDFMDIADDDESVPAFLS